MKPPCRAPAFFRSSLEDVIPCTLRVQPVSTEERQRLGDGWHAVGAWGNWIGDLPMGSLGENYHRPARHTRSDAIPDLILQTLSPRRTSLSFLPQAPSDLGSVGIADPAEVPVGRHPSLSELGVGRGGVESRCFGDRRPRAAMKRHSRLGRFLGGSDGVTDVANAANSRTVQARRCQQ